MQNLDKFWLFIGLLWAGMLVVFVISSSPRYQQRVAQKLKAGPVVIAPLSGWTRLAGSLMFLLLAATAFVQASHHDLAKLLGLNPWMVFVVTFPKLRYAMIIGILLTAATAGTPVLAQTDTNELARLNQRVDQLEKQVQELSQLVAPLKAQQTADGRRQALREKFDQKMTHDRAKYTRAQLAEAEQLYQVANQKWGTPEAAASLQKMISQYPDINRTGCAMLYIAQKSKGNKRVQYLQDCIDKYGDCYYGDGVQVGAYARFLLLQDHRSGGENKKADALAAELKTKYPDAIDHGGALLADALKSGSK
ncbi:MAG: hypothetical protein JF609_02510 [Verrucomicrobia bacterium]|nr:hypothetical protein [Verrucomicrobiota bacterium]